VLAAALLTGCGLNVESPDLFLLTRTGQPRPLTMLVNDGGTVRCNGGRQMTLPDPLLVQARGLASDLDADAKAGLHIAPTSDSVAFYTIKLPDGTISFPDTAAARHKELAQVELFAIQAAQQGCRIPG
jgi:hypothetical protein